MCFWIKEPTFRHLVFQQGQLSIDVFPSQSPENAWGFNISSVIMLFQNERRLVDFECVTSFSNDQRMPFKRVNTDIAAEHPPIHYGFSGDFNL